MNAVGMRKIISSLLVTGSFLLAVSCKEDEEIFPVIETTSITAISASSFLVEGNIAAAGNAIVLEYGFVYSLNPNPDVFTATKEVVGTGPATGPIEKTISIAGQVGEATEYTIFVRAFLTNQKGTVYGMTKDLTVPKLTATSVAPLKAKTGDQIVITGTSFGLEPAENEVRFNGVLASVVSATSTSLTVTVPAEILYPSYSETNPITVKTGGQTTTATENFRLLPTVTDFSPKSGTFGTTVTLTGSDFYPFSTSLTVGGIAASATSVTDNSVTFNIPSNVTSATLPITLVSGTDVINVTGAFSITPPQITSVTPLIGLGGTRVTILGSNFNLGSFDASDNVVRFGTSVAEIVFGSSTEIIALAPKGLAVGSYAVSVFTGVHTVAFGTNFTLTSPSITSFTPMSGIAGSYVTITGMHFGELDPLNSVLFGANPVQIYTWENNTIIVFIPVGTPSGSGKITVNASGQSVASAANFTIL
jgi:hypothetical protein